MTTTFAHLWLAPAWIHIICMIIQGISHARQSKVFQKNFFGNFFAFTKVC